MKRSALFRASEFTTNRRLLRRVLTVALTATLGAQTAALAAAPEGVAAPAPKRQTPSDSDLPKTPAPLREPQAPDPETMQSPESEAAKTRVLQLPTGSFLEVRLIDGQKFRGRLGDLEEDEFMLKTVSRNRLTEQKIAFCELRSIRRLGTSAPRVGRWTRTSG
jgi:hypothetical protein